MSPKSSFQIRRRIAALAASTLLAGTVVMGAGAARAAGDFDVEAHRGGRALWPENTLVSFSGALSLGVSTLEMDLGITQDGQVVISHERGLNPDLARDANGVYISKGIPYSTIPLATVKTYDVGQIRPGSAYAAHFPDQKAVPGTRVPTLSEVIALVRKSGNSRVKLNIETKIDPTHPEETVSPERFVAVVLDLLRREKFTDRVMIQSFDWRTLQLVQKQAPEIPTVYLTAQVEGMASIYLDKASPWTAGFDPMTHGGTVPTAVKAAGGAIWSPYYKDIDKASVAQAHELGLKVVPWTTNDTAEMGQLIDMGVDGIISDRPDLLRQVVGEKGLALPAPTPVSP